MTKKLTLIFLCLAAPVLAVDKDGYLHPSEYLNSGIYTITCPATYDYAPYAIIDGSDTYLTVGKKKYVRLSDVCKRLGVEDYYNEKLERLSK